MLLEGIQTNKLCKIRLNASDKDTTGVDAEKALSHVFGNKYRIRLGHPILDDHWIFYPQALFNPPRQLLKAILLLFIKPSPAGTRKAEKYMNPDITKVSFTVNGSPNKIYNNGIEAEDMWRELSCFFQQQKLGSTMDLKKFYTGNKFGVLSGLHSMADTAMHGSAVRLVNTNDRVFLEVEKKTSGSGSVKCHVFTISDAQMNTRNKQLQSVKY